MHAVLVVMTESRFIGQFEGLIRVHIHRRSSFSVMNVVVA